jgi:hypothetical protein
MAPTAAPRINPLSVSWPIKAPVSAPSNVPTKAKKKVKTAERIVPRTAERVKRHASLILSMKFSREGHEEIGQNPDWNLEEAIFFFTEPAKD